MKKIWLFNSLTLGKKGWRAFLLAHFGKEDKPETVVPKISQGTLAEMVGTPVTGQLFHE